MFTGMKCQPLSPLLIIFACLALMSCGEKPPPPNSPVEESKALHPLRESYLLLDKGENSKAVLLLEDFLRRPDITIEETSEGKFLLASACFGLANINIYTVYDGFKDLFFQDPLAASFWDDLKSPQKRDELGLQDSAKNLGADTKLQKWLDQLDTILRTIRQLMSYLNRFPSVSEQNWSLLQKGLKLLEEITQDQELENKPISQRDDGLNSIRLYRMFIRVIHMKSYLLLKLIADESFGTRTWACHLNIFQFHEGLEWLLGQLQWISKDFATVYPLKKNPLSVLEPYFSEHLSHGEELFSSLPPGTYSSFEFMEKTLKVGFGCFGG